MSDVKSEAVKIKKSKFTDKFESVINSFDQSHQQAIQCAIVTVKCHHGSQCYLWQGITLICLHMSFRRYLLSGTENLCFELLTFVIDVVYHLTLHMNLNVEIKGGQVIQRHNEVYDAIGDLSALVWKQVKQEPVVREADTVGGTQALVADLGVWMPQTEALCDIGVVDTDTKSYGNHSPIEVLALAEKEKKRNYGVACEKRRAVFTPFVCLLMVCWEERQVIV